MGDIKVLIKDVIASDPQLDWFWPQVLSETFGAMEIFRKSQHETSVTKLIN